MQHSQNSDHIAFYRKKHTIRKVTDEGTAAALLYFRELARILDESGKRCIHLRLEAETKPLALPLIPKRGLEELEFGLG